MLEPRCPRSDLFVCCIYAMTAWRTSPDFVLTSPRHLAEKFHDLGWRRMSPSERRRIRRLPLLVCQYLRSKQADELAKILHIKLPDDFVPATAKHVMERGKNALMHRIRETQRAARAGIGESATDPHSKGSRPEPEHQSTVLIRTLQFGSSFPNRDRLETRDP
jgi:hypothetical protein